MSNVLHPTINEFKELISNGVVLVDFYADRCGPCRSLAPIIEKLADQYDGRVNVAKIDVDGAGNELAFELGIVSIPTVIIYKDGNEYSREIGLMSAEHYTEILNNLVV